MRYSGLGKGLSSLIPSKKQFQEKVQEIKGAPDTLISKNIDDSALLQGVKKESVFYIEVDKVKPNPYQPRHDFNEDELRQLADSIKEYGVIQPIIVSKIEKETSSGRKVEYQIIAGERRLRAAKMAGHPQVPVIIRGIARENQKLELALIENVQRSDLNAIEKAKAFRDLIENYKLNQKEIAEKIGKSPEAVSNTLRLLELPQDIQKGILDGKISEGHARAILAVSQPEKQRAFFAKVVSEGLSVRDAEELSREIKEISPNKKTKTNFALASNPEIINLVQKLEEMFGSKVLIRPKGGGAKLTIEFYSAEDLKDAIRKIIQESD